MANYTVRVIGASKDESVAADSFSLDENNNLQFITGGQKSPSLVFAAGQWQFVKED